MTATTGALEVAFNTALPSSITSGSVFDSLQGSDGRPVVKSTTLSGNGAQNVNLFQFTGSVLVQRLWGICKEATDATTLSSCFFDLWDGSNAVPLNDAGTPTDCSGLSVGSSVACTDLPSNDLPFGNADQVRSLLTGPAGFQSFIFTQKNATSSYVRFLFTGDANTDVDMEFTVKWAPISSAATLVVV